MEVFSNIGKPTFKQMACAVDSWYVVNSQYIGLLTYYEYILGNSMLLALCSNFYYSI